MTSLTARYLDKLRDGSVRLSISGLQALSDLGRSEIAALQAVWPSIPVIRRRQIMQHLVELAEENLELDFTAVFKAFINDADSKVREAAVEGLWEDTEPVTADLLIHVLTDDPTTDVRAQAAATLGHFMFEYELEEMDRAAGERIKAALLKTIKDDKEPLEVRRRAVESISYVSDEAVTSLLIWAYNHADVKMRVSAVRGMGRNCDQRWLPNIFEELMSANPELRFEAAGACGEMEDKRCVPKLVPLLKDEDVEVRVAAVTALGHIGGKSARRALVSVLETSDDEAVQEAAQEALEEMDFFEEPLGFQP